VNDGQVQRDAQANGAEESGPANKRHVYGAAGAGVAARVDWRFWMAD
jgi:hypothetical protein